MQVKINSLETKTQEYESTIDLLRKQTAELKRVIAKEQVDKEILVKKLKTELASHKQPERENVTPPKIIVKEEKVPDRPSKSVESAQIDVTQSLFSKRFPLKQSFEKINKCDLKEQLAEVSEKENVSRGKKTPSKSDSPKDHKKKKVNERDGWISARGSPSPRLFGDSTRRSKSVNPISSPKPDRKVNLSLSKPRLKQSHLNFVPENNPSDETYCSELEEFMISPQQRDHSRKILRGLKEKKNTNAEEDKDIFGKLSLSVRNLDMTDRRRKSKESDLESTLFFSDFKLKEEPITQINQNDDNHDSCNSDVIILPTQEPEIEEILNSWELNITPGHLQ